MDLQESRAKIDEIDKEIADLFEKRMDLSKEVAADKIKTGKAIFDPRREQEKLAALEEFAGNEFNRRGIRELFAQIMSISRKLQYGLIPGESPSEPFDKIKRLKLDEKRVVFFGESGSYTEQAMEEYFGMGADSFSAMTFKEVMEAIRDGRAEYGVLPIENSSTGGIADIYDLLADYSNYIIGEHVLKVDQALLGLPGASRDRIETVYSHPQGLMQCAGFLERHPQIRSVEFASTAGSAKKVLFDGDITQGAIASRRAALQYGLAVLEPCINDNRNNATRFIVITGKRVYFENANKVSICFLLPHVSGSLYNMLSHIIYNNLNMTKIESRPIVGKKWEYRFFVDFEGNLDSPGVKNTLRGIGEEAIELRILGNFCQTM